MKKFAALIFALCFTAGGGVVAFSGCAAEEENLGGEGETVTVIADFETWGPSFQLMRLLNGFGKVSENTEADFVKNGSGSAKLQPLGFYSQPLQPYLYFPTYSRLFGRDKTDFSRVKRITAWIYSGEEDVKTEVGLIASIASVSSAERIQQTEYVLEKGWNYIVYDVDLNILNISYDVKNIQGIAFSFENAHSRDLEDAPVLYLDDVLLIEANEEIETDDVVDLAPYEICDFERLYQDYVIAPSVDNPLCIPDIARVSGENGVSPTSGSKMLKVVTRPGETAEASWPRFTIPEKIMQKAFASLTEEEKSRGKVQFDVYNAGDTPKLFYPEFYSAGGGNWQAFNVNAEPGKWVTFSLNLSALDKRTIDSPGYFKIAWAEYIGTEQTFYFDNFRIVIK